jgi:SAM-dependent methyltransferase
MGPHPFARMDPTDDAVFYRPERKLVHIEAGAIEALRRCYAEVLPPGGRVLDLMSSWRSHLPEGLGPVVGLGMNAAEMTDNPQLSEVVVHDLNREPRLPFPDGMFDAAVCAVSVQYLVRPLEVLGEVARVLVPGGPLLVAFSNRCFPTKAVVVWLSTGDAGHRQLVRGYLEDANFTAVTDEQLESPDDPVFVVQGLAPASPRGN